MIRSDKCVLLSHCLLAQTVRANGLAKYFPAAVKPVVQFCLDHDINMIQMPCPELSCGAGGFGRDPHGKTWYLRRGLRETCTPIARNMADYARRLVDAGNNILAVIGMEFSPACAVTFLNKGPVIYRDQGVFIEELKAELAAVGLEFRFIGVNQRAHKKLARQLQELLVEDEVDSSTEDRVVPRPLATEIPLPMLRVG